MLASFPLDDVVGGAVCVGPQVNRRAAIELANKRDETVKGWGIQEFLEDGSPPEVVEGADSI